MQAEAAVQRQHASADPREEVSQQKRAEPASGKAQENLMAPGSHLAEGPEAGLLK